MTLPTDIPKSVSQVEKSDIRAALGRIVYQNLKPIVSGLAGLYGAYAFGHPVFLGGETGFLLAAVALGTSLLFLVLRLNWAHLPTAVPWPHAVGTGIVSLVLGNALLHFYITGDIAQSTNIILLLVSIGFLSLSTRWYAAMAGMTVVGWLLTVWMTLPHAQLTHYGFAVVSAAVLATVGHIARRRSTTAGERERIRGQQLRAELARSLQSEATTRRALEESNAALEKAVEEAEEMNRLQAAFLADLSHEIRTPLTSIIGFAEMLDEKLSNEEPSRFVHLIEESGRRLLETLNSVLDLSKLKTESVHLNPSRTNVSSEIQDTARLFQREAQKAGLSLTVDVPPSLEAVVDASALHRCCSNLISNAIKYTNEGGSVTVRAWAENDNVVVEVEDTGIGIDDDFQEALFEPFEQSDEDVVQDEVGTGLGLAITQRLVSLMGGHIDVESTVGEGSVFTVRVPRWMDDGTDAD